MSVPSQGELKTQASQGIFWPSTPQNGITTVRVFWHLCPHTDEDRLSRRKSIVDTVSIQVDINPSNGTDDKVRGLFFSEYWRKLVWLPMFGERCWVGLKGFIVSETGVQAESAKGVTYVLTLRLREQNETLSLWREVGPSDDQFTILIQLGSFLVYILLYLR